MIHDISQPLGPTTASWPGDRPFRLDWSMRRDRGDSVDVAAVSLSVHTGTHVDGPAHVVGGPSVDELPLEAFYGPVTVVDARPLVAGEDPAWRDRVVTETIATALRDAGYATFTDLADADVRLFDADDRHHRLAHVLEDVQPLYDFIFVDCPPSTSLVTINAMIAADAVIIPVSPAYLALEGIVQLGAVIKQTRSNLDEPSPVLGLALTMVDRSAENVKSVIEKVRGHYGEKVFSTEIRTDSSLAEAAEAGQSIFAYDATSPGAEDYAALAEEIMTRVKQYRVVPSTPHKPTD